MLPFDILYFGLMLGLVVVLFLRGEKSKAQVLQISFYLIILIRYFMLRVTETFSFGFVAATVFVFLLSFSISLWRTAKMAEWKRGIIEVSLTLLPLLGAIIVLTGIYM